MTGPTMFVMAQAGLGAAASGLMAITVAVFLLAVSFPPLFLLVWFLPEILRFLHDRLRGRDLLAESQEDRRLEGRLFSPEYRPFRVDDN